MFVGALVKGKIREWWGGEVIKEQHTQGNTIILLTL